MNTKYLAVLSVLIIAAATIGGALLFVDQNDSDESYAIVVTDDAGKEIIDTDGESWPMVNVIDSKFSDSGKLSRFGYTELCSEKNSMILPAQGVVRGHEFHRWDGDNCGNAFRATKTNGDSYRCMFSMNNIVAGFPHLYYYSNPEVPCRFVEACIEYSKKSS